MKINKETFNIYLKIAPYLLLKFTVNILLFSFFVLIILKFKNKINYIVFTGFFYFFIMFFFNIVLNKEILYKSLNIKKQLFLRRKKILKKQFTVKFNYEEYGKDNLIILLIGIISFIILGLVSIPLILMVKKTTYIIMVLIFAFLFTILFISNIISPLMLINEYKNMEKE